ncbi:MAG: hypothetical protein JNL70_24235 [Saprospiraceae bacterium]|nr:hypothetical protein [Saprospiraceae bacterium]
MALPIALKKGLKITGITLAVLLAAAIAIPYFFKDKILVKVKEAVNKELNAKVDFKDVDISILRHFPKVSVRLEGLDVKGVGDFDGVTLMRTEGLDLALNFWSVWRGGNPYEVNSIYLDKPFINIVALSDGSANYNITKPKETASEPTDFKLSLSSYAIKNGTIIYDDRAMNFYMALRNMDHEGSGEMTADVYDLDTETVSDSTTMSYGGMTYLSNAHVDLKTIVNADMKNMKFTLKKTDAAINALKLNLDGWTQLKGDDILMDMTFKAPSNDFKDFFSIIPAAYTKDYSNVKATGTFNFDGFVKGTYNSEAKPTPQYPAFKINLGVQNGTFQYPSLPMGGSDINTNLTVALPNSDFNSLQVDVPNFHIKLGNNPFDAVFKLRTPVSDPDVDLKAKGTINLGELTKVLPMESVQNMTGIINADVAIKTLMSYIDKKQYEKVNMNGILGINGMNVQAKGYPSVLINNLAMKFTPNSVNVDNFTAQLGKSDLQASGNIDNILAFFSTTKTMTGNVKFASNVFDANEWLTSSSSSTATSTPSVKTAPVDKAERPFDRFDFTVDGRINKLLYEKYDIQNSAASGHFTPNKFVINNFTTKIGNTDVGGNGTLLGVFDWMFEDKLLGGNLNLTSNMMDLNQFMTDTPAPASAQTVNTATEPFLIPKNLDVTINAKMNRVLYTNMDLSNLTGKLVVANEEVKIEDASANAFGGRINIKGGYNTQNPEKPTFKLAYDMKGIDFKQSFNTFNTFQKLAPIGQYLTGKFNTNLEMGGELGKDLMPNFSTLNAAGFLQTLQGFISGLKPLDEIANKLNISELKNLDVKETKNWFEIQNGSVKLNEFDKTIKDIKLTIGGTHSLTNEMNYTIKTRVPRKRLESNAAGAAASAAYTEILSQASKYGLNIKNSEFVNVLFTVTGSMLQPKVAMKVMSGDGQATLEDAAKGVVNSAVDKAKDSITIRANEELDKAKTKAKEIADKAADSARNVVNRQVEEAKAKAVEEAKKRAGEAVGGKAGEVIDKGLDKINANEKVKQQTDKLKDKLDKFDPFKKKPVKKDSTGN